MLNNFYMETLSAFRRLVPRLPTKNRNLRVTTFTVPASKLEEVRMRIRAFHSELATLATEGNSGEGHRGEGTGEQASQTPEPVVACQLLTAALFHEALETTPMGSPAPAEGTPPPSKA